MSDKKYPFVEMNDPNPVDHAPSWWLFNAMTRSIVERRKEKEALHWHQPYTEAVPLDLWELFRAITYERYGEVKRERLMETVAFYSKKSDKLDAYRIYPEEGDGILTAGSSFKLAVGIRYGMDVDDYDTPFVSNETAALFNLDPYH